MAVVSKATVKSFFEAGDRPTQQEFEDLIDSYVPIASGGAVGFMDVQSTASSIARPAETLVAIATAGAGGKTGIIEVLATAEVTTRSAGAVGLEVLSAISTASAQGHLGGGAVGLEVFSAITTASAQGHLNVSTVSTASETNFGIVEIATQAEMEAATATDRVVTPARAQNHPGVAKVWINFTGIGTIAINESHNVTSITDEGVGDYTVTFDTDFATAEYAYHLQAQRNVTDQNFDAAVDQAVTPAVGSIRFQTFISSTGGNEDAQRAICTVFGDQ